MPTTTIASTESAIAMGAHVRPGREVQRGEGQHDDERQDDEDESRLAGAEDAGQEAVLGGGRDHREAPMAADDTGAARVMIAGSVMSSPPSSPARRPTLITSTRSQSPISSGRSDEMAITPTPLSASARSVTLLQQELARLAVRSETPLGKLDGGLPLDDRR